MNLKLEAQNQIVRDETINKDIVYGYFDLKFLTSTLWKDIFAEYYNNYKINERTLSELKNLDLSDLQILIVLGSWCGDSKEQVPPFIKIADELNIKTEQIKFYGVEREYKKNSFVIEHQIRRVPTFVIYIGDKEKGRIVETPIVSLEDDLLEIIKR